MSGTTSPFASPSHTQHTNATARPNEPNELIHTLAAILSEKQAESRVLAAELGRLRNDNWSRAEGPPPASPPRTYSQLPAPNGEPPRDLSANRHCAGCGPDDRPRRGQNAMREKEVSYVDQAANRLTHRLVVQEVENLQLLHTLKKCPQQLRPRQGFRASAFGGEKRQRREKRRLRPNDSKIEQQCRGLAQSQSPTKQRTQRAR